MAKPVKINDEKYNVIAYSSPRMYERLKTAEEFIKINFLTIPQCVEEEEVAEIFQIAGTEQSEKKQIEILFMAQIIEITAQKIGDITNDQAALLGYKNKSDYFKRVEKHLNISDLQRMCIVTRFKKLRNLEDYMNE
ncbi:MAG: hypothetical protein EAX96_20770 [Candidatus Lokiarchaeota archaeon]|nr:hypothetical protein [Candidatus Lokiarchaeota archaeon]